MRNGDHQRDRVRLFIVGTPRSGTTLAQRLVQDLGLWVPRETHFASRFLARRSIRFPLTEQDLREVISDYQHTVGVTLPAEMAEQIASSEDARRNPADVLLCLLAYGAPPDMPLGEKTPNHLMYLTWLLREFPKAKAMVVVRHPVAVVSSLRRVPFTEESVQRLAARWAVEQWWVRRVSAQLGGRVRLVRYEDLVRDYSLAGRDVKRWLHLEHRDAREQPTAESWEWWKRDTTRIPTPGDADRWQQDVAEATAALVWRYAGNTARTFGYSPPPALAPERKWTWGRDPRPAAISAVQYLALPRLRARMRFERSAAVRSPLRGR